MLSVLSDIPSLLSPTKKDRIIGELGIAMTSV